MGEKQREMKWRLQVEMEDREKEKNCTQETKGEGVDIVNYTYGSNKYQSPVDL